MKLLLTAHAFGHEAGDILDIADDIANYLIVSGRAKALKDSGVVKSKANKARKGKIKRAGSPNNKMLKDYKSK